ncbi:MAG: flippase [candidate division WOR-3 bacterium]|nr:MAG: flippase [candidate division WOR-3 bacterium]
MIARKVSLAFFSNVGTTGLGYISLFFVARYMGPEALGIIAFALAYVGIFRSFSDLGFGSAHVKRVSEGKDFGVCNGTYFSAKMLLTLSMSVIVLATVLIPKAFGHSSFVSREHELVLYVMLLSTIIGNASMMINITFGARKETAKQSIPLIVGKVVEVSGKVIVAVVGLGVVMLAGASLISAVVILFCFIYLFRGYPVAKPTKEYLKSYAKFALPVVVIAFLTDITHNMDKVMIQFFWTTSDVGFYSAAQQISFALSYITIASTTLIFPTISAYHSQNKVGSIRSLSNRAERYLSMVFSPALIFILILARPICTVLLGAGFAQSAPLLVILVAVVFVNGTTAPYTQQIGGTNHIFLAAKISVVIFVLDAILNVIFIPREFMGLRLLGMGGIGAAVSTLISISVGAVLFRFYAYKITGSKPNPRVLRQITAAAIMGVFLFSFSRFVSNINLLHLVAAGISGVVLYTLSLVVLGEFDRKDASFFFKILNPLEMKRYASAEISREYADTCD